ncbi:DUF1328 domain-containing protein [Legionella lytica]|uniref:DUF1328 domain-containing protein n=1 Tax=Legionella lytica TaxID=96232 RepID=A0ABY4YCW9_9GAMM|nr:DUF1328 domain-containing protein [Legionella lytica]USQ14924.1 DUF1328 domain-containing protein [Legionella lytica]
MLAGAFIFFAVALFLAIYLYKGTNPTLILLAKVLLYFSLVLLFILLIVNFFNHVPPIPDDKKNLPL